MKYCNHDHTEHDTNAIGFSLKKIKLLLLKFKFVYMINKKKKYRP